MWQKCKCPGGAPIVLHTELENRWFASWLLKQCIQGVSVYTSTSSSTAIGTLEWATLELEDQQFWRLIGISKRPGVTVTGGRMNKQLQLFLPWGLGFNLIYSFWFKSRISYHTTIYCRMWSMNSTSSVVLFPVDGGLNSGLQYHQQKPVVKKGRNNYWPSNLPTIIFFRFSESPTAADSWLSKLRCVTSASRENPETVSPKRFTHLSKQWRGGSVAQCQLPKKISGELIGSLGYWTFNHGA